MDGIDKRATSLSLRANSATRVLEALPVFGEMKVKALGSVLAKRFGVKVAPPLSPPHPTLGDVDSPQPHGVTRRLRARTKAGLRA